MEEEEMEIEAKSYVGNSIQNGKNIALKRYEFMNKEYLDYEDYVWALGFMGDFKLKEGKPDSDLENWTSYAIDLADKFKNASISEITEYFHDPVHTNQFRADFVRAFSKMETRYFSPYMREGFWAWKKPDYVPYNFYSDEFWMQTFEEGQAGVMLGEIGSGKTDFTLKLAEKFLDGRFKTIDGKRVELKRKVATNIAIPKEEAQTDLQLDYINNIQYFNNFSGLMLAGLDNIINGYTTYAITDEMTVAGMRKKRTMSGATLNLDEYMRLTRKIGIINMFIWHLDTEIPSDIYSMVSFIGRKHGNTKNKLGRRAGTFSFKRGNRQHIYYIKDITPTVIPFKTRDIAPFELDIPLDNMIKMITAEDRQSMDDMDLFKELRNEVIKERKKRTKKNDEEED